MEISFIIVNYRSESFLKNCLASIRQQAAPLSCEIVIVNNDAVSLEQLADDYQAKLIRSKANVGFARACNLGAQSATGEILFFLNPDTELLTSNINELIQALRDTGIGIVAPLLTTPNGSLQPWSQGGEITPWKTIVNNLRGTKNNQPQTIKPFGATDWVSGAALAISKKTFFECGVFDEKFFMYFEDVDLCRRVRDMDKKILILSQIEVLHHGGKSIENITKQKEQYYASQDYYFKKHFGILSAFIAKLLRNIFLFFSVNN
jgi:GT2 family glycosyltransferase